MPFSPSPLHEVRSALTAAQLGLKLLKETFPTSSTEETLELIRKIEERIELTTSRLDQMRRDGFIKGAQNDSENSRLSSTQNR